MKTVIAGGSGFLGRWLARDLRADGHQVTVLTRRHPAGPGQVTWNPLDPGGEWTAALDGADAVVNLAGRSIAHWRWTASHKAAVLNSRLQATHGLVAAMLHRSAPAVFVSSSAVGYYGLRGAETLDERSPAGSDFLARVCRDWEAAAMVARSVTRVVLLRTGLVLDRDGGVLPLIALPFRLFAGGPLGSGRQYLSWIHRADVVAMLRWAIDSQEASGPVNATAPGAVTNREFARELGRALNRSSVLRTPGLALRLALGREMADALLLGGQRVEPARALAEGFRFRYRDLPDALGEIYPRP